MAYRRSSCGLRLSLLIKYLGGMAMMLLRSDAGTDTVCRGIVLGILEVREAAEYESREKPGRR